MLWLRLGLGLLIGYAVLLGLVWAFQERIAFPAPRAPVPEPRAVGLPTGERIELVTPSGTRLLGWYLPPRAANPGLAPGVRGPGLLWFYGNGENIAAIWPVLREFQPPGTALLVVDYPGYGGSGGRATEPALYEAAAAAYDALVARADVNPARVFVYGRSLGSAPATWIAARRPAAGLILESPFTSAREMSGRHYGIFPGVIVRLRLDNLTMIRDVRCPVLVFHGTADRLVPIAMGRRVAEAAPGPVELVEIEGSGHNDSYSVGGSAYREKVWEFVRRAP